MKLAILAGESSGDQLGADLVAALKRHGRDVDLMGVGGPALAGEGLSSLFDYSELSVMGISAILARLPALLSRIRQTADAVIAARPDCLILVDSPDFTHRVARRVRKALPDLKVVNYVCPSVWAWKEYRAVRMRDYVDLVLAVLPFEPAVMARLGGPKTIHVGHRLAAASDVLTARAANKARRSDAGSATPSILIMPGSRRSEVAGLFPVFLEAASQLRARLDCRFVLPCVPHLEADIRARLAGSDLPITIVTGGEAKWQAFGAADAALAASGTAVLELALAGVPVVSCYRLDWLMRMMIGRIKTWSAALPNLVLDSPVVPEFYNDLLRPGLFARHLERLAKDGPVRAHTLSEFDRLAGMMAGDRPAGEIAAEAILGLLR